MLNFDIEDYLDRVARYESGGNYDAKSKSSSATGGWQFLDGTRKEMLRRYPELGGLPEGRERDREMAKRFTIDNVKSLSGNGIDVDPAAAAYAAHHFGAGGARAVLSAAPETPLRTLLGDKVIEANPHLRDLTAGQWREKNQGRWGGQKKMFDTTYGVDPDAERRARAPSVIAGLPIVADGGNTTITGETIPGGDNPILGIYKQAVQDAQKGVVANRALIEDYLKRQPDVLQKIEALRKGYKEESAPTLLEQIGQAYNSYNAARTASDAGRYATKGGIATRSLPDVRPQLAGIEAQAQVLKDFMRQRQQAAKDQLDSGIQSVGLQTQQDKEGLGLRTGQNTTESQIGLKAAEKLPALQKMVTDAANSATTQLGAIIKNPDVLAEAQQYLITKHPRALLQGGTALQAAIADTTSVLQKSGKSFAAPQKGPLVNIDQKAELERDKALSKDDAERQITAQAEAKAARPRLRMGTLLLSEVKNMPVGVVAGSERGDYLYGLADQLGLKTEKNLSAAQLFDKLQSEFVLGNAQKLKPVSASDLVFLKNLTPNRQMTKEALTAGLKFQLLTDQISMEKDEAWAKAEAAGEKSFKKFESKWDSENEARISAASKDIMEELRAMTMPVEDLVKLRKKLYGDN